MDAPRPSAIDIEHGSLFDSSAAAYERFRPAYPQRVIDAMIGLSNLTPASRLLEIGCGTGKATFLLASRGYAIDCLDPGKRLIALAEMKCAKWPRVSFTTGRFEEIGFQPLSYDLVFSAQAFHWVDPAVRLRKVARLLRGGGSLALLYNYPGQPTGDEVLERLSKLIQRESGGQLSAWRYEDEVKGWLGEIRESGLFKDLTIARHQWQERYSAAEYVGLFSTFSDFLSLPKPLQGHVAKCIQQVITRCGGHVCRPYDCILIHARRRASRSLATAKGRRAGTPARTG